MNFRQYIISMFVGTFLSCIAFLLSLFLINPEATSKAGFFFWYSSLFLASLGIFSSLGVLFRIFLFRKEKEVTHVVTSLRQSFWAAAVMLIALMLLKKQLLNWWNVIMLCASVLLLELIFLSQNHGNDAAPLNEKGKEQEDGK